MASLRSIAVVEIKSREMSLQNRETLLNMKTKAHLNLAQYYIHKHVWETAESHARAALHIDSSNTKGVYRLVVSLLGQNRFDECRDIISDRSGSVLDNDMCKELLQRIHHEETMCNRRQRQIWLNMFASKPNKLCRDDQYRIFSCCKRRNK